MSPGTRVRSTDPDPMDPDGYYEPKYVLVRQIGPHRWIIRSEMLGIEVEANDAEFMVIE